MDKILDKLGIYDLVAVLLSGVIMTCLTLTVCKTFVFFDYMDIGFDFSGVNAIDSVVFLIASYLVGTIFQELGSLFIKYCIDKDNRLLKDVYNNHIDTKLSITSSEQKIIETYIEEKIGTNHNISDTYNYCRYMLLLKDKTKKADQHQYISAQGRSLSIYFFILFFGFVLNGLLTSKYQNFLWALVCLYISLLMYVRCIRFIKLRYVDIFRSTCYEIKNIEGESQ